MFQLPYSLLPPYELPHFGVMEKVFDEEEVDRIRFYEKILDFQDATIVGQQQGNPEEPQEQKARIAKNASIPQDENTGWLWNKIAHLSAKANYDLFLYDISFLEDLSYTIYIGTDGGHYVQHVDTSLFGYRKFDRKISGILMLSDPDEYEGGTLAIDVFGGAPEERWTRIEKPNKGDLIFFDSHFVHKVEPVTSGKRQVLVFWVDGKSKL